MKKMKVIYILGAVVLALALTIAISLATSSGPVNLMLRNMLAFDKSFPEYEFNGKTYENVQYSEVSESDYLHLYVPESDEPVPLLILVHGGGFVENDLTCRQARLMYEYCRSQGYACATINYRLAGEATFPAAVEDVKAAVKFLRYNADKYGYDAEKFAIWGESAGGYLATMVAVSGEDEFNGVKFIGEDEAGDISAKVDALLDFYGVINLDKMNADFDEMGTPQWLRVISGIAGSESNENSFSSLFLGTTVSSMTEAEIANITPNSRINENLANKDLKVYISHGSVDITVPGVQSTRLYEDFKAVLGAENVEYHEMKNFKHADDRFYQSENLTFAMDFLKNVW